MNASKNRPLTVTSWTSVWRRFRKLRPRRARNSIKTSPTLPCLRTRKIIQICCFYRTTIVKTTTVNWLETPPSHQIQTEAEAALAAAIEPLETQIKKNTMTWTCNQITYLVKEIISRRIQILSLRRNENKEGVLTRMQILLLLESERTGRIKKANARFSDSKAYNAKEGT